MGGIADVPGTRGRKATLGGSGSRSRSRGGVAPEGSLGSPRRSSSPRYRRSRPQRPKNRIYFLEQKTRGLFAPRCQLIPLINFILNRAPPPPPPSSKISLYVISRGHLARIFCVLYEVLIIFI